VASLFFAEDYRITIIFDFRLILQLLPIIFFLLASSDDLMSEKTVIFTGFIPQNYKTPIFIVL
jgi:hypothetical protein